VALLLPPLLLLGSVEALYRYELSHVGELPRAPSPRTGFALQVLWLVEERGPLQLEPLWPWRFVNNFVEGARHGARGQRSAGQHLASMAAGQWLASRPRRESGPLHLSLHRLALSIWISRHWTAEELLTAYAEGASFGKGLTGLDAAARRYFGQEPEQLALHEVSLLAGLPQSPGRYDPFCRPEAALKRRDFVLSHLVSLGWISETQWVEARTQPLLPATLPAEGCTPR
jgi:Transglycosylase